MTPYLRSRTVKYLKFRIVNGHVPVLMRVTFQINEAILTVFSGVPTKKLPSSSVAEQNCKRRRQQVKISHQDL